MGIIRTTLAIAGYGSLAGAASFIAATRYSKISALPASDYIFNSTLYSRYNPNNAPATQDLCTRKVPLSKIKPELLEKAEDGKLVEAFCQGVWGGLGEVAEAGGKIVCKRQSDNRAGYAYQRRFLEKKYRGPNTASQLWDRKDLKASEYPVGTQITDHFEVVSKTPTSIIVRCGDSPRKLDVRESDGLFEMLAEVKKDEGVAEFGLKSVFYNGLAQPDNEGSSGGPMSPWIQWLHAQYDKVLMETALRGNVMK
ncbi:hypothetical protein Tdes44962_MAKER05497 [Teratosphaeria destructans]|uniref:Uncharacterized protein n=1 Tax=Teratosphaeria destructans TaxID=418781 RepID=A0A9W7VYU3_9PEZI|nr:hypothetical protein Tdes44962_MAKER05497 [Teratosphaeria destructans]